MNFTVVVGLRYPESLDLAVLEGPLDRVMEELVRLDALDPSISVDLDKDVQVRISIGAKADSHQDAIEEGLGVIRTALHAAEWHTPGWPDIPRLVGAELVDA